jgi:hypothetical protein
VTRYAVLFAIGLAVYGTLAWSRLGGQSIAPHFVIQADAWLHGQTTIEQPVPGGWGNDWAKVDTVVLADGREVRGRYARNEFRILGGEVVPAASVRKRLGSTAYMSFPPLPTLLMLPSAAVAGRAGSDTIPNLLVAALIPPLALLVLRRLAAAGLSKRSEGDDLWLVALLAFGTVMLYASVQASVWYLAHVCGVVLALVYAWAAIEAKRPLVAGLALGAAALTRTPMAFMFPLFVLEAIRMAGGPRQWRAAVAPVLRFAAPVVAFAIAGGLYNYVRFGSFSEFGHTYLEVRQQAQIEEHGLFSGHYLLRNLVVAFLQVPLSIPRWPYVAFSGHGLALWVTTPALALLASRAKSPIRTALWVTIACVALPSLLYQNTGWVQFGYRFALDYMVFVVMLIACCGRALTVPAKLLIVASVVVNIAGAIVFGRFDDRFVVADYDHVQVLGGLTSVAN